MQAPKIILVHNHPSGETTPSQGDFIMTDRMYECSNLMGIQFLDHIVIGDGEYESILKLAEKKDKILKILENNIYVMESSPPLSEA